MRNRNMKNDKVVRAIALALSSVLASSAAMPAMTAYAEGVDTAPAVATEEVVEEAAEEVVVEEATEEIVEEVAIEEAEEVSEENAVEEAVNEIKEAGEAASDVVISIPLGIVSANVPLEGDVVLKDNVAASIIANTDKVLDKVEDVIDKKLDQSVVDENGEVVDIDGDDDDSLIDDKTINELNEAESVLAEGQDIIDTVLANASSKIEAGLKTSEEAQQLKDELTKAEEEATAKLSDAEAELEDAKLELEEAQAAYEEAKGISEAAEKIAMLKVAEAQILVNSAARKAETLNNALLKIDSLLDGADRFLDTVDKNLDEMIGDAQDNLDSAISNLDESIDNLKNKTDNFVEKIDKLEDEIDDVKEATGDFVEAVKDAYYTQKDLDELYSEYANAKKALNEAQQKLREAKAAYDENGGEEAYNEALVAYNEATSAIESIEAQYEDIKAFNEKITNRINGEMYNDVTEDIVRRYIAKDGEKVEQITDGKYGKYGDGATYIVVKDEEDNVVARYAYERTEEGFDVKPLKANSPEGYYTLSDGTEVPYTVNGQFTVDGETVEVKGTGNDLYIEGDEVEIKSVEDKSKATTVYLKDSFDQKTYPFDVSDMDTVDNGIEKNALKFTYGILELPYYMEPDGRIYTVETRFTSVFPFRKKYKDYNISLFTVVKTDYVKNDSVVIDDQAYPVSGSEKDGYTYTDKDGNNVVLVKNADGKYVVKNSVTKHELSENEKEYVLSDNTSSSLDAVEAEYDDKYQNYKQANEDINRYKDAKSLFDDYNEKLKSFEDAEKEADRTDLVVKRDISIDLIFTKYEKELVYGDLAKLPRSILDLISVDSVIGMDSADREDVMKALNTIITTDNQAEKLAAIVDVVMKMGGSESDAYVALLVALGDNGVDEGLEDVLSAVEKIPFFGKDISDAIKDFVKENEAASPFQKNYANAWKDALDAKVNVVVTGVNLANQAGEAVIASIDVLKAGVAEGAAITDVTIDALRVAVDGIVLGGLYTGNQVVNLADKLVEKLDAYVEELQEKTQVAADEAKEAKNAVEKLKINAPGSQELAKALVALQKAEERVDSLEVALNKAQLDLQTVKDKAAEAEEITKKLEAEENQPVVEENEPVVEENQPVVEDNNVVEPSGNNAVEFIIGGTTIVISPAVQDNALAQNSPLAQAVTISARRNSNVAAPAVEEVAEDVEVEETEAPAVASIDDNEVPEAAQQTVTIDDNETALSASIPVDEKMSWWWLILVIVAGGTGLEMYRRHQLKKKAAEVNND